MNLNKNYKARNLTNELNLKVQVTYFSSNLLFKLTESLLVLLHGVRDLKILIKTLHFQIKSVLLGFFSHFQNGVCHFSSTFCSKGISKNIFFKKFERFNDFCHESSPLVLSFKMQLIYSRCHYCLFSSSE